MPPYDVAVALGGRVGWLYWPEGGQQQLHCRGRRVMFIHMSFSRWVLRPPKIAHIQCNPEGVAYALAVRDLLIPFLPFDSFNVPGLEKEGGKRGRLLKQHRFLSVSAWLF